MALADVERFSLVVEARPGWFSVERRGASLLHGIATVTSNSADADGRLALDISIQPTGIRVRETHPGTCFPVRCPERHIELGGWFCLGLRSGWSVEDAASASIWWEDLDTFVHLQRAAGRLRFWPEQNALSHGKAGDHHRRALDLAAAAGLYDAYNRHLMGQPSIISVLDAKLTRTGGRLLNGRAACPCGRRDRRSRLVLRRDCPHRSTVLALLAEERQRVVELDRYWRDMRSAGVICCGTMKTCPLALGSDRSTHPSADLVPPAGSVSTA